MSIAPAIGRPDNTNDTRKINISSYNFIKNKKSGHFKLQDNFCKQRDR